MRLSMRDQAIGRVAQMFLNCEDYTRPADIIADIMHYCQKENGAFDFDQELAIAETYVTEELGYDEQFD